MIKQWINPIGLAAVILSAIAIALPVMQWASIPTDQYSQYIYGLAALALGLCKLAFFPKSATLLKEKRYIASSLLAAFAIALLYISIESSSQFLRQHTELQTKKTDTNTLAIDELNTEIANINALLAKDSQSKWIKVRDKVKEHQLRLDKLKTERDTLLAEATTTTAFFAGIITKYISAEYLIAICIHLGGILAILCVTAWSGVRFTIPSPAQASKELEQARTKFAQLFKENKPQPANAKTAFKPKIIKTKKKKTETQEALNRHD